MPSAFGLETLWAACGHAGIPGACLACGECPSKSLGLWRCSEKGSVPLQGQGWASVGNIHIDRGGWRAEVLKEGCSQRRPFLCARLCVQRSGDLGVGIKWEARWPLGLETWVLPLGAVYCLSRSTSLTCSVKGHASHSMPGEPHQNPVASASSEWTHCHLSQPLPRRPIWASPAGCLGHREGSGWLSGQCPGREASGNPSPRSGGCKAWVG